MLALEVAIQYMYHTSWECNAGSAARGLRVGATVQKVRYLGMCGPPVRRRRRASHVACWSPTPPQYTSHRPRPSSRAAATSQREPFTGGLEPL